MLQLQPGGPERPPKRLLAIGAHSDDIEIGCGGTIFRLLQTYSDLEVTWVVLSARGNRADEARASAEALLQNASRREVHVHAFRDGFLPYEGAAVKERFEKLKQSVDPDLILTHYRDDAHQDHRLASELTWNTFRDHLILEFEIPKYDGDFGTPNFFITLDDDIVRSKTEHLAKYFNSQTSRRWFTDDLFRSVMRLRGMECNSPTNHAEAFYCRKSVF